MFEVNHFDPSLGGQSREHPHLPGPGCARNVVLCGVQPAIRNLVRHACAEVAGCAGLQQSDPRESCNASLGCTVTHFRLPTASGIPNRPHLRSWGCCYDSAHEGRRDFLNGLRGVSTASEWEALARSDRARVPWPVLRARSERANLTITGMSRHLQSDGSVVRVFVLGVLTTRSDLAVLRSFEDFSLTLVRQPGGWRVAAAEGPGL